MSDQERIQHTFIVRLWREPGSGSTWRGSIEHVPDASRRYFIHLPDLVALISNRLDQPRNPAGETKPNER